MVLDISHVSFGYTPTTEVLRSVTLSLGRGEIVGLIGPNGSGKSTLIRCMCDLLKIRSGTITIAGSPHTAIDAKTAAILLASNDDIPEFLTGKEFVDLNHRMYGVPHDPAVTAELFRRYAMEHRENALIEDYSHGMRKKLQLVTALSLRRPLTIIDETLNGVDLDSLFRAEDDIRGLAKHGSALVCSHDFRFLEAICDRIVVIESGDIIHDASVPRIVEEHGGVANLARAVLQEAGAWT